jgi:alkylated DNA repair protein alkB family protein 1
MVDNKSNEKSGKVSVFKKVFSRHKRKAKDPNCIHDLLHLGEDGSGVIDVSRIRIRARDNRNEAMPKDNNVDNDRNEEQNDITATEKARNSLEVGDGFAYGKDLVVPVASVLPGIPYDTSDTNSNDDGGRCCSCFGFREFPGVFLYPRALDRELQLRLAYEAVTGYCELGSTSTSSSTASTDNGESQSSYGSHRTNIDLLPPKAHERVNELDNETETMWNLWKRDQIVASTKDDADSLNRPPPEKKPKRDAHNKNKSKNQQNNFYRRFSKFSWATMGYHYDWTERCYHPQKKSRMPDLVAKLSTLFATATPTLEEARGGDDSTAVRTFNPSASIVNYYTTKSIMGGHRDDLEDPDAMDKPIVSMSLGLPGIFVLGGPTKDEYEDDITNNETEIKHNAKNTVLPHPVRAILLRPGDVLIMGGASRLNYHCMARVLPHEAALEYDLRIANNNNDSCGSGDSDYDLSFSFASLTPKDISLEEDETEASHRNDDLAYLTEYLRRHRINVNVRQVYPDQ